MVTAIIRNTRCRVVDVEGDKATVHALTAWRDTGWAGPAEIEVDVADLCDVRTEAEKALDEWQRETKATLESVRPGL